MALDLLKVTQVELIVQRLRLVDTVLLCHPLCRVERECVRVGTHPCSRFCSYITLFCICTNVGCRHEPVRVRAHQMLQHASEVRRRDTLCSYGSRPRLYSSGVRVWRHLVVIRIAEGLISAFRVCVYHCSTCYKAIRGVTYQDLQHIIISTTDLKPSWLRRRLLIFAP